MRWPDIESFAHNIQLPTGVRARQLARGDVPGLIRLLSRWQPSLAEAEDAALLTARFYEEQVALAGEDCSTATRPTFVIVLVREGAIVSCTVNDFDDEGRVSLGRFSVVAPEQRGQGLGRVHVELQIALARAGGAVLTHGFVELDNLVQSGLLIRAGYRVCGVLPDADWKSVGPRRVLCVSEAALFAPLVSPEQIAWPEAAAMRPATAALMKLVFDHGDPPGPLVSFQPEPVPELEPATRARVAAEPSHAPPWPELDPIAEQLAEQLALSPRVVLRRLRPRDLAEIADRVHGPQAWQPAIEREPLARLRSLAFDDSGTPDPVHGWCVVVDGALAGLGLARCDVSRSWLFPRLIVTDPRHDELKLPSLLMRAQILTAQALELETITTFVPLRHLRGQLLCEATGFRLVGISPASERRVIAAGAVRYASEAVYSISLVPPELRYLPPREQMQPEVASVVDFVFGPR
ncbi:hypothetical protein ENSA5_64700 [Enhygromyxa salina]|uniref:N-acetyltransferase domain-containing protein n=1 Tax=Enhygromyxa salina TaxID=215803 RepID=A0A2S9XC75_9BACT|nr:hypothetical protein [Enhygromyxa salina]PRP90456.1 hypothetical protein ENSA5_64700 [Enhygromyxa salina]